MNDESRREATLSRRSQPVVLVIAAALLALTAVATVNAHRSRGRTFAGLFTDAHGSYSAVWWPAWGATHTPVQFPDQLIALDGQPVPPATGRFDLPTHAIAARLHTLRAAGHPTVETTWRTHGGKVFTVTRPLMQIGADEPVFFFGLYALVGAAGLWSGLAVFLLARRRDGAIAYALWSIGSFIFMVTFYDYHSTAVLAPLFSLSTLWVQICLVWLAYSFPERPVHGRSILRVCLLAFTALGVGAAVVLMVAPYLGQRAAAAAAGLRVAVSESGLLCLAVLSISVLVKLRRGAARSRKELASAALGLAASPALLAAGFALTLLTGAGVVHLLLPFLAPLLPLSIGYALIRHNILGTTAVLTRRMFAAPVITFAAVVSLIVWLALHAVLRSRGASAALPWVGAPAVLIAVGLAGYRLSGRAFFAATARFRPTLQQLADDLASKGDVAAIGASIQEAVMRWLPTEGARVVMPTELHQISNRPDGFRRRLSEGEAMWTSETHWRRQLCVPMRSQGELRGVLALAPKHETALYTREDLDLLETIASLGAVALHNAGVILELDMLRRFEVDAARDDKRLALGLLGAEISHEIAYPLNFLRYLLRQGDTGRPLEVRDLEVGREEIGRLERMFAALHRLRIPVPRLEPVLVLPRVHRALDLIRETVHTNRLAVTVDIPPDLTVLAEPDGLVQIFSNLLRNAAQAAPPGGAIGAWSRAAGGDGTLELVVWDDGPGVAQELAAAIFSPFVTGKQGSTGLGLAVTQRLVRNFGWSIDVRREDGRTLFGIEVPPAQAQPQPAYQPMEPPA